MRVVEEEEGEECGVEGAWWPKWCRWRPRERTARGGSMRVLRRRASAGESRGRDSEHERAYLVSSSISQPKSAWRAGLRASTQPRYAPTRKRVPPM